VLILISIDNLVHGVHNERQSIAAEKRGWTVTGSYPSILGANHGASDVLDD